MPLIPGTRLGVYEIVEPIGSGGMGEVYRTTDPTPGRHVAHQSPTRAELSLAVWLLVTGVRSDEWDEALALSSSQPP